MTPGKLGVILLAVAMYVAATWAGYRYVWLPLVTGPEPIVRDEAGVLTSRQVRSIHRYHQKLLLDHDIDYRAVTTAGGVEDDINAFAYSYFREHAVGSLSGTGRGLLLVIDVESDRVRLEVSRALEGVYTDGFISYVQHRQMIPFFRTGRVADGVLASTELIFTRAQEAENGRAFVPPTEAATAGAGVVNPAQIGAGEQESFREGPDVTPADNGPRAVLAAYGEAMAARNGSPNLSIYTRETQEFLARWTITPAQMDNAAAGVTECPHGTLETKARHAVLHYPVSARHCPPYFFRVEGGRWRLDLAMMGKAIRFNHRNQWRFLREHLDSDRPYAFAFVDWQFDENGFPLASPEERAVERHQGG